MNLDLTNELNVDRENQHWLYGPVNVDARDKYDENESVKDWVKYLHEDILGSKSLIDAISLQLQSHK